MITITLDRKNLYEKIKGIQGVAWIDTQESCLIDVKQDLIGFASTNLELFIKTYLPIENNCQDFKTCVNAKKFYEIIKNLPDDTVTLGFNDGHCLIQSGKSKFKILTGKEEYFPKFEMDDGGCDYSIFMPADKLMKALDKVLYALSDQGSINHALDNLLIKDNPMATTLEFVASDGHRLAIYTIYMPSSKYDFETDEENVYSYLITKKSALELKKFITFKNHLQMIVFKNTICFKETDEFYTRLASGTYPNYEPIIAQIIQGNNKVAVVDKESFINAVKRVSIVSHEINKTVILKFTKDQLEIKANSDIGDAVEKLDIKYNDDELITAFNAKYLIEGISRCEKDEIELKLDTPESAFYLEEQYEDGKYQYFLMPIRL